MNFSAAAGIRRAADNYSQMGRERSGEGGGEWIRRDEILDAPAGGMAYSDLYARERECPRYREDTIREQRIGAALKRGRAARERERGRTHLIASCYCRGMLPRRRRRRR